jgi:hypothetical protein
VKRSLAALLGLLTVATLVCWLFWFKDEPEIRSIAATPVAAPEATTAPRIEPAAPPVEVVDSAPAPAVPAQDFGASELKPKRQPDFPKIVAFNQWASRWAKASPEEREEMRAEGLHLAQVRRPEFKALIVSDPQRALEQAVSRVIRQDLPPEIVEQLEKPVSATGDFRVYRGRPSADLAETKPELTLRYFETPKGESYKAHVFGALESATSKPNVPMRGVAVDREFAPAESPVRQLEVGERVLASAAVEQTCEVSGITSAAIALEAPITDATPAVEIGERVILLCNGTHVSVLDEQYRQAMGQVQASGPGAAGYFFDNYPGTSSEAIGNFRCLYIRITYPDQMRAPNTEDSAHSDMRNVSRYYLESSFGKLTTTSTVTPLVVLPHTQAWYIAKDDEQDGLGLVHSDARAAARKLGYDSSQFNCTIVRVNGGPRLSGISWGGGDSVWVSWDGMDVLNHECGHSLGRNHANFWQTNDGTAYGAGANQEYGNSFDVMGGGSGFGAHYNTISKRALGWLPDPYVHRPTAPGVFRLFAYDQPQLEEGKRYAFRVAKDSIRNYYIEYHPAIGGQWPNAALVMYSGMGSNAGHLLDTTPGSSGGKGDGGIQIGRTYSDPEADLHFTVVSKNDTSPPSLDLAYYRGPFPDNQPPVVNLTATATNIAVGGSITFNTNATDPNGDTLAFQWDFSDGFASTSTSTFTRSFPATDQMTVMVAVSDMKGGVTRRSVLVNVGNPGRNTVSGQVTHDGQPLAGVRISSDNGKYCFTNSDGTYVLSDLVTGARTLTAVLNGYTFTPQFTNPITVAIGNNVGNWTASAQATVTLVKSADAVEGGANGAFVLTRTGSTAGNLVVRVSPVGGTATRTTDYTFTPDYVDDGSFRTFTIPSGQASLTINVQAVNDTAQEGPETITLQLASNPDYLTFGPGAAIMTLEDNDTTLPKVSVLATGPYATETPGETGVFTFSRTGPTTNAVALTVAYSGGATNGTDYATLPTTVTIPAGQVSTTLNVSPLNDTTIELPEDCVVTISSNATYVRDGSAQSAAVTISDDDLPSVSVSVLDGDALEAGRDPGVFLLTRTGSTAAPLKVYYGLSGSALHGTDYMALNGEVTFPAGATSVPVIITPYDDDLGEPETQSVTLLITTFDSAYTVGSNFTASFNIVDNDDVPVVSVRAGSTSPAEPSTNGSFAFRATGSAPGNITVHYTVSGTATSGADFTALSGTVVLSAGSSNEVTVNIPVLDDGVAEDTESVIVTITPDPAYRVYNDGSAMVRLRDNDSGERVMISTGRDPSRQDWPTEAGVSGRFYLSRSGTAGVLSVNYSVSGTAINGTDYTLLPGSAIIPDGASGVDVLITPANDSLVEGTETITLSVAPGTGYGAEIPNTGTLYLIDNETMPISVGFESETGTTTEALGANGEFRDINVILSAASADPVTVEYTSNGGTASGDDIDWTYVDPAAANAIIPGGVLTFPPGNTVQTVRIKVRNDGLVEGNETAILDLRNPRFARLSTTRNRHTLTISDANDPIRRVRFLLDASTRSESQGTEPMLMAVLDRAVGTGGSVSVNYSTSGTATNGIDYQLAPGTLTFAAGESVKLLPFTIIADVQTESPETVIVTLTNPSAATLGSPSTHTITLRDSTIPAVNVSAVAAEVSESQGSAQFTISRSGAGNALPLTVAYTVGGTATSGTDYAAPAGSIVIPAGSDSVSLPLAITDDTSEEEDETIEISISPDAAYDLGSSPQTTTTILDDDASPVVSITSPVRSEIAIPPGVGLMLRAEGIRTTPQGITTHPVTWSMVGGPGTVAFEVQDAVLTAATFPVNGAYILRATASAGTSSGTTDLTVHVGGALTAANVGTTVAAGSWSEVDGSAGQGAGGTITINGGGTGLSGSGTSDGFYFLAAPKTGDFDVRCRVVSVSNPGGSGSCRFGLMVRASTTANAPYAMCLHKGPGEHAFQARLTAGADPYDDAGATQYTFPRWIRLTRVGNDFSAYHSADGETWTQRGTTQTITTMGTNPLLGLAITSAVPATASSAVFDDLSFTLPTNVGPMVNAGPTLSGAGPWNLNATVTDDGKPTPTTLTPLWRALNGPATATFGSPSSIDTSVTFPASGLYRLRLTVSDGAITTFDETTADVTSNPPLQAWRQTHFGTTANAGDAANDADWDRDGIVNLLEYGLGSHPKTSGNLALFVGQSGNNFVVAFQRDPNRADGTLLLDAASELSGSPWITVARSEAGGPMISLAPEVTVEETPATFPVSVTITIPMGSPQPVHRFFRIRVQTETP